MQDPNLSLSQPRYKRPGFTILESVIVLGLLAVLTMVLLALWKHAEGTASSGENPMTPGKTEAPAVP